MGQLEKIDRQLEGRPDGGNLMALAFCDVTDIYSRLLWRMHGS